jgi:hypothetical protein
LIFASNHILKDDIVELKSVIGRRDRQIQLLDTQISELKSKLPDIIATPQINYERALLEVHNRGGGADFEAKASIIEGFPSSGLYTMCWDSILDSQCHINGTEGVASILIAEIADKSTQGCYEGIFSYIYKGGLKLYKQDALGRQIFPVYTGKDTEVIREDEVFIKHETIDECVIEISITSEPPLQTPFGKKQYKLEIIRSQIRLTEL